jgi:hypothetical protein
MFELPVNLIYTESQKSIPARLCSASDTAITVYSSVPLALGDHVTWNLISDSFDLEVTAVTQNGGEYLVEMKACSSDTNFSSLFTHIGTTKAS